MNSVLHRITLGLFVITTASCTSPEPEKMPEHNSDYNTIDIDYQLTQSSEIIVTSEAGDKLALKKNITFSKGQPHGNVILIRPDIIKQTMTGVGTSFTESSAFVLAHLETDKRQEVMKNIYGRDGANFSLARTHIGATDFAVEGKYSYAEVKDDARLEHFSIAVDSAGFSKTQYPGIRDESYDLLPMIKEANGIKREQDSADVNIVASAWTAPPWMKDIEDWYSRGIEATGMEGTGGELKPQHVATYADYLVKYLDAYSAEGIDIWGLTPVNEPHGNSGQWESMHFTPETQSSFIKEHLGPKLQSGKHKDIKLLIYDQNRDGLEHWTDTILADDATAKYVYGTAVHWYESTFMVYEDVLDKVHHKFPDFDIIHTEGTIDDLGKPAFGGIMTRSFFRNQTGLITTISGGTPTLLTGPTRPPGHPTPKITRFILLCIATQEMSLSVLTTGCLVG